jgi:uncharacterized repeat protein (TIGR01451 family)
MVSVLRRSLTILPFLAFVLTLLMAGPAWAQAELSVNKTGSPNPVVEGDTLTYRIVVENTGEIGTPPDPTVDNAQDVEVEDVLDPDLKFVSAETSVGNCTKPDPGDAGGTVLCDLGDLEPGDRAIVTIRVRPTTTGPISNTATATSSNTAGDSDTTTTTVLPELVINKLDDPDPVREEGLLHYTLRVTNQGDMDAFDVVILDDLPLDEVDFIRLTEPDGFTCEYDSGLVRCEGDIPAEKTRSVDILVEAEKVDSIENTARVRQGSDPIDSDTERTVVEAQDNNGGDGGGGDGGGSNTNDLDCDDFDSQADAQDEFDEDTSDPNNLDDDGDNIACEQFDYTTNTTNTTNTTDTTDTTGTTDTTDTTSSADPASSAAADAQTADDLTGANGADQAEGAFRCELFLRVEDDNGFDGRADRRHAGFLQYFDGDEDLLVQRIEQCRESEVLADTIPNRRLPGTGGPPLALLAAGVLLVSGLVAGASVLRAGFAARRRR